MRKKRERTPLNIPTRAQWLLGARQRLAGTEAEIAAFEVSREEWERRYHTRWPGTGDNYKETMYAQRDRLQQDIDRVQAIEDQEKGDADVRS